MITFGLDCPYCKKNNVAFEVKGFNRFKNRAEGSLNTFSLFATCNNCGHGVVSNICELDKVIPTNKKGFRTNNKTPSDKLESLLALYMTTDHSPLEGLFPQTRLDFLPKKEEPSIPEHLPSDVESKLRSAEKLYLQSGDDDFLEPTATSYRKVLEVAISHLDTSSKTLYQKLNWLVDNGFLVKSLGDFAHRIRILGNAGAHHTTEREDIEDIRLFTQLFLQYVFTLPKKIPVKEL